MAYLGVPPQSGFITTAKQRITSSTNNYVDLDHAISNLSDVIVWVNFVKQDSTNLSLTTSTRITLGGTLVSSDIVEIAYLGKAVATQTPDTGTVTNDMLAGSIANSKLATDPLNASNLASGTVPTARLGSGTASSSTFLRGDSTFATVGGSDNTPSFHVFKNAVQSINNATSTLITWQTETWDTDGKFASNRFTPTEAGKYFIYFACVVDELDDNKFIWAQIKKNGSLLLTTQTGQPAFSSLTGYVAGAVDLGSGDYVEAWAQHNHGSARNVVNGTNPGSYFGGFKIIT